MFKSLRYKLFPQWLAAVAVMMMLMESGIIYTWTSPYLRKFMEPDSPIPVTPAQGSWMASLMSLGRLLGAVLGALAVHTLGSRSAALLAFLPMILSWVLIYLAGDVGWLYVARVSAGTGLGMGVSSYPLYIGEFAESSRRGSFVSIALFGTPTASVLASYLGSALSHTDSSVYFALPAILGVLIFALLPDTPYHHLEQGRPLAAERSLAWYRGGRDVNQELSDIQAYVGLSGSVHKSFAALVQESYVLSSLLIVVTLFTLPQVSGYTSFLSYMEIILRDSGSRLIDPSLAVVLLMTVALVFSIVSVLTIDRLGRRTLLIASSLGSALGMFGLGTHFYLIGHGWRPGDLQLLPLASMFTFQTAFTVGLLCVPAACLSEMMSQSTKGTAACLASIASGFFAFVTSKAYQPGVDYLGQSTVFFGHGVLGALAIPFAIFIMPETKGRSLNQIQRDLMKR